ncbi:glutathione S-transferase [Niveispirillum sp. SYP-B3756]|uniref:glutathione S-transferase family protein n=1 Tax=Niveispirillum sp. SYP-B3756 TaxID=2662178 RepID=UPI001291B8BE|nr:glutathione S-transferase [Niveispirillum sp. SYP-B3756]MQP64345.1 glutathione S-transferase [Niveispirillum sp. SYP-B3756]
MIRVHHLNISRSLRVLWLLEEVGLDYEVVRHKRDAKTMRAPLALRNLHPLGKLPIVEMDGQVLAETGLIIEYILAAYAPHLAPAATDAQAHWRYRYWMHYAEGSLMPQLLLKLIAGKMGILALPIRGMVNEQVKLHLDYVEKEAGRSPWLAGDQFSAADIMMSFPLEVAVMRAGLNAQNSPHITRLLQAMQARPAYQRAVTKAADKA